jgi:hypothetical protein
MSAAATIDLIANPVHFGLGRAPLTGFARIHGRMETPARLYRHLHAQNTFRRPFVIGNLLDGCFFIWRKGKMPEVWLG